MKLRQSLLLTLLSLLLLFAAYLQAERNVIRMHIIAESDTESAQQLKLQVRDALLPLVDGALEASSPRESLAALLPELAAKAESVSGLPVTVTLRQESYGARFDSGSYLPAGRYTALRVTLGAGQGHNWWGVVYPEEDEETELHWWIAEWLRGLRGGE